MLRYPLQVIEYLRWGWLASSQALTYTEYKKKVNLIEIIKRCRHHKFQKTKDYVPSHHPTRLPHDVCNCVREWGVGGVVHFPRLGRARSSRTPRASAPAAPSPWPTSTPTLHTFTDTFVRTTSACVPTVACTAHICVKKSHEDGFLRN